MIITFRCPLCDVRQERDHTLPTVKCFNVTRMKTVHYVGGKVDSEVICNYMGPWIPEPGYCPNCTKSRHLDKSGRPVCAFCDLDKDAHIRYNEEIKPEECETPRFKGTVVTCRRCGFSDERRPGMDGVSCVACGLPI